MTRAVIPLALLLGSFAWSFVYVSLPFYIQRLSPLPAMDTLRWTGWILGITPLMTVVMAPVWGRLAERGNPKRFYVIVQALQALAFFGMALAGSLLSLFGVRLVLGLVGASSTFAFMIAGRAEPREAVQRRLAAMQSMMTVGQIIGPLAGALVAVRIGFRGSFVLGAAVLAGCAFLVGVAAASPPAAPERVSGGRRREWAGVLAVSALVLGASIQVSFLASVLPQVVSTLGVSDERTLSVGGMLIFVSGIAAALGSVLAPRLAAFGDDRRVIGWLMVASSALLIGLAPLSSVWAFGPVLFAQMLCVSPVFPIAVGAIAQRASGGAIGFVNSARIAASFLGPVVSTTVLSWSSTAVLYVIMGLIGLVWVPIAFAFSSHPGALGSGLRPPRQPPSR